MHITVHRAEGRIHIGTPRALQAILSQSPLDGERPGWVRPYDEWEARSFLRRHFGDGAAIGRLRGALASSMDDLTRWSDEDVLAAAALRLARGAWQVAYEDARAPVAVAVTRPRPASASRNAAVRSERPPRPAPAAGRAPAAASPADAPAPASEWSPAAADQVAQAETLEQAARDGTPFCEICEARRKAALEAQHA